MHAILASAPPNPAQRGVPTRELELHRAVARQARVLVSESTGTAIIAALELRLPPSRPDVVLAAVRPETWEARRLADVRPCTAPLPLREAARLRRLFGSEPFAVDRALHGADTPPRSAARRRALTELKKLGILRVSDDLLILDHSWRSALVQSVGVEAKIGRFDEAANQVRNWRHHFDRVFVAFPGGYARQQRQRREPTGGGILAIDDGQVAIVRRARRTRAREAELLEEHLYARWLAAGAPSLRVDDGF